jgi:hypothetical protein
VLKCLEGTATRDVDAEKWYFTGREAYLSEFLLPENFDQMAFQHWRKIISASGDTCHTNSFVTIGQSLDTQTFDKIGQIEAVLTPASHISSAQLPVSLRSMFVVISLFTSAGRSKDYDMPLYSHTHGSQIIDIKVLLYLLSWM